MIDVWRKDTWDTQSTGVRKPETAHGDEISYDKLFGPAMIHLVVTQSQETLWQC
jgi:hypothetical protein